MSKRQGEWLPVAAMRYILQSGSNLFPAEEQPSPIDTRHLRTQADLRKTGPAAYETKAPILGPSLGRTENGYYWAMTRERDDRPWGGKHLPTVVYLNASSRGGMPCQLYWRSLGQ